MGEGEEVKIFNGIIYKAIQKKKEEKKIGSQVLPGPQQDQGKPSQERSNQHKFRMWAGLSSRGGSGPATLGLSEQDGATTWPA